MGYSPWSLKESDMTETTYHAGVHTHSFLEKYQSHTEFPLRNANMKKDYFFFKLEGFESF